jgi:hypothetical protein
MAAKSSRYNKRTGQTQNISPELAVTATFAFSELHLYYLIPLIKKHCITQETFYLKTVDGGNSWQPISPDLSRESWDIPASLEFMQKKK